MVIGPGGSRGRDHAESEAKAKGRLGEHRVGKEVRQRMPQDNFAAVRERVDPVALVVDLAKAKVKSRSPTDVRLAPCPFCGSKTGFSVNPQTKTYCCHHAGCGAQGDVFREIRRVLRKDGTVWLVIGDCYEWR